MLSWIALEALAPLGSSSRTQYEPAPCPTAPELLPILACAPQNVDFTATRSSVIVFYVAGSRTLVQVAAAVCL